MSRLRNRQHAEEEDASALKLGTEFNNAGCLLISEVKYLLENRDKDPPDTALQQNLGVREDVRKVQHDGFRKCRPRDVEA